MEIVYHCVDCGKDFIIDSRRNTHAKRCPECRIPYRRNYLKEQKRKMRSLDKDYAKRMKRAWELSKFNEDPVLYHKKRILQAAKARSKKDGIPFNLTIDDIEIPDKCPVFGIDIVLKEPWSTVQGDNIANYNSPSLDRIIPEKGYVKGNVWVISYRANTVKNNMSIKEIEQLYNAMMKLKERVVEE